jgi:hypothetical protein
MSGDILTGNIWLFESYLIVQISCCDYHQSGKTKKKKKKDVIRFILD